MEEIMKELNDFKKYVGNFEFDLIMVSINSIVLVNQSKREIIQWNNYIIIQDIINHLITSKDSLNEVFNCNNIIISTNDYIKSVTSDCKQFV